jgi:hypothetical protein
MKYYIRWSSFFAFFFLTLTAPAPAHAQETTLVSDNLGLGSGDLTGYLNNVFELALLVGAILAVLIIASAGLQYMSTDAVSGKTTSRERIVQAVLGLLMLLGVWLFFNEIDPKILDLTINQKTTEGVGGAPQTNTNQITEEMRRRADIARRAALNPILPGSTIGTSYTSPTWTSVPVNKYCNDVRGPGWVGIDARNCAGTAPNSQSRCCGKDPNYKPPAVVQTYQPQGEDLGQFYDGNSPPPTGSWCYNFSGGAQCYTVKDDCIDEQVDDTGSTGVCVQK